MARKRNITKFAPNYVATAALQEIERRYFGGLNPSDFNSNWNWITVKDFNDNFYGIVVRFGLEIHAISFAELNYFPVFGPDQEHVSHFKHWEDLTIEEENELKACGFLAKH